MPDTTKQQLLRSAVAIAGLGEVAVALKAPPNLVEAWMNGHASMPDQKLRILADFLDRRGSPEEG